MASTRDPRPESDDGIPIAYGALDVSAIVLACVYIGILHPCPHWADEKRAGWFRYPEVERKSEETGMRYWDAIKLHDSSSVTLLNSIETLVCSRNICLYVRAFDVITAQIEY